MSTGPFVVTMYKTRATWNYFTRNEVGGGFGSNHCGSKRVALAKATNCIKSGQQYQLIVNGKDQGIQVQP